MDSLINSEFYKVLSTTQPDLLAVIEKFVTAGITPKQVGDLVEGIAGKKSVLPGLAEGAAKHMLKELS